MKVNKGGTDFKIIGQQNVVLPELLENTGPRHCIEKKIKLKKPIKK